MESDLVYVYDQTHQIPTYVDKVARWSLLAIKNMPNISCLVTCCCLFMCERVHLHSISPIIRCLVLYPPLDLDST